MVIWLIMTQSTTIGDLLSQCLSPAWCNSHDSCQEGDGESLQIAIRFNPYPRIFFGGYV